MHNIDEPRLDQLRHWQRRGNADERLIGKTDCAFRNRMDIAGETEAGEIVDEIAAEASRAFQPVDFGAGELQRFKIDECVFETGRNQKAAPGRQPSHEKFEDSLLVLTVIQIGLDHVEFVEVGRERAGGRCHGDLRAAGCV